MAKVVAVVATTRSTNVRGRREQFDVFFAVDVGAVGLGLGERCSASGRAMASAAKDPAKAVPASLSANVVVRSVQHGSASAFSHQATVSRTVDEQSTSPSIASTESSPSVAVVAATRSPNVRGRRAQFDVAFAVDVGAVAVDVGTVGVGVGRRRSASEHATASPAKDSAKAVVIVARECSPRRRPHRRARRRPQARLTAVGRTT